MLKIIVCSVNYKLFSLFISKYTNAGALLCLGHSMKCTCFSSCLDLGLNFEINIEQDEYIGPLTPEAGIRVDISPQGAMPFPLDKGVSLAPGYATMIGLRKVICIFMSWLVCVP